ncbi:MAG: 16S rRNA (cytidine(1402)-2'-O)-methyltransferase [Patescibacteria group bacterium]
MLYIVATPIGNLSDSSDRMIETLKKVDTVLCEDTRVTRNLCNKFGIETPLISYHHHSNDAKKAKILKKLQDGEDLALVTDAGTPGVADPAGKLINMIVEGGMDVEITPIPGPSAVAAAASVSGFYMNKFTFLGFPPKKKKRTQFFKDIFSYEHPVIFYESPHRILKTLSAINNIDGEKEAVVCRELTKKYERIYRGKIKDVFNKLNEEPHTKGEFTVIIKN